MIWSNHTLLKFGLLQRNKVWMTAVWTETLAKCFYKTQYFIDVERILKPLALKCKYLVKHTCYSCIY